MDWFSLLGAVQGADKALGKGGDIGDVLGTAGSVLGYPELGKAAQVYGAVEDPEGALVDYGLSSVAEGTDREDAPTGPDPLEAQRKAAADVLSGGGEQATEEAASTAPVAFSQDLSGAPGLGVFKYADGTEKTSYDPELASSLPTPEALQTDATATEDTQAALPEAQPEQQEPLLGSGSTEDAYQNLAEARQNKALEMQARVQQRTEEKLTEVAANEQALRARQEEETAATQASQQAAQEVAESQIDPSRAWTNLPAFGKVLAIMTLAATPLRNVGSVLAPMIGYINQDIEAQKSDKDSRYNHWRERLKSDEAAEAATKAELIQSAQARSKLLDEQAGAAGIPAEANEANAMLDVERQKALDVVQQQTFENTLAERRMQVAEGQLGVQRSRLALDREMAAKQAAAGPTYQQMLKEMEAKLAIGEIQDTGRSPKRNQEIRQEAKEVGGRLEKAAGVLNGLDRTFEITGITRDKSGNLVKPDDIEGLGWWDRDRTINMGVQDRLEANLESVRNSIGRAESGGAITEDELEMFSRMLPGPQDQVMEKTWFNRVDEFDKAWRAKMESIANSMSREAFAEYSRRINQPDKSDQAVGSRVRGKVPIQ